MYVTVVIAIGPSPPNAIIRLLIFVSSVSAVEKLDGIGGSLMELHLARLLGNKREVACH
jgi:hypothetical protein